MTAAEKTSGDDLTVQEHCIDLPGESVKCWIGGGTDKLKVILRKHRDVIFDIHLGSGKTYTLEATESDFYCPRDKKLVYAARHGRVTFSDGERMHVWVGRGFRGALVLKRGEHIISEVKPNEWDTHRHGDDPKEKPAPIIVAIGSAASTVKPAMSATPPTMPPLRPSIQHEEQSLHLHEVSKVGAPPAVLQFFENGGESLHLDSENIVTRNWITAQIFGAMGYSFDNRTWIKELMGCTFYLQRVTHKSGPKIYIVFSGSNKLRELMSASRYSLQNTKILKITGGAGGVKQGWDAAKGAAKDSLTTVAKEEGKMAIKGGGIAVYFSVAMDIAEWYKDYSEIGPNGERKKDFCDLFAKVGTDLVKAGLITALTTAAVSIGVSALVGVSIIAAAPVLAIVVGTIVVSAFFTYFVEKGDRALGRALGEDDITTWLAKKFRTIAHSLAETSKDIRYDHYAAIPL
jgi:hypothetical protein